MIIRKINILRESRKAHIASTINWVAAFLIIFFILIVYVSFSGVIAAKKGAIFKSSETEIYVKADNTGGLNWVDLVLNTKTENKQYANIREMIISCAREKNFEKREAIRQQTQIEVERVLGNIEGKCYVLSAGFENYAYNPYKDSFWNSLDFFMTVDSFEKLGDFIDPDTRVINTNKRMRLLQEASSVFLVSKDEKIKVLLYLGEAC